MNQLAVSITLALLGSTVICGLPQSALAQMSPAEDHDTSYDGEGTPKPPDVLPSPDVVNEKDCIFTKEDPSCGGCDWQGFNNCRSTFPCAGDPEQVWGCLATRDKWCGVLYGCEVENVVVNTR